MVEGSSDMAEAGSDAMVERSSEMAEASSDEPAALPESATLPTRPLRLGWLTLDYPVASVIDIVGAGGAYTKGALLKATWKLVLVTFLLAVYAKLDGDFWSPFLYSRVHCCDKGGNGGPMLAGKYNQTLGGAVVPACEVPAVERDDEMWSQSIHCDNRAYVLDQKQQTDTMYQSLKLLGTILFLPIGGHVGDVWVSTAAPFASSQEQASEKKKRLHRAARRSTSGRRSSRSPTRSASGWTRWKRAATRTAPSTSTPPPSST